MSSKHNEFDGIVIGRNGSCTYRCCDCGKFIKRGEETGEVVYQYGEPHDPEYEMVHRPGFGCKREAKAAS